MPVISGGSGGTIWLQKSVAYAGKVDESPLKTVTAVVDVPVYAYARDGDDQPVTRRATADVLSASEQQPIDQAEYRLGLDSGFITGAAAQTTPLATAYVGAALSDGSADDLLVAGVCRYLSDAGDELGQEPLTFLCVPNLGLVPQLPPILAAARESKLTFLALNRKAFLELKAKLHGLLRDHDGLLLLAIGLLTTVDENGPALREVSDDEFKQWLDIQVPRLNGVEPISGDSAKTAREAIRSALVALHDLPLTIPEVTPLAVAGTLTIVAGAGHAITEKDFLAYVLSADLVYDSRDVPVPLSFRFAEPVAVNGGKASFSLTEGTRILRNDLVDPVTVAVKGIDGSIVWRRELAAADPALRTLDITVPLQGSITLTPADGKAVRDPAKKLRGSVLTYDPDCVLKDALVLVRAKAAGGDPWRVVGAAMTDASGNFSVPYPYGAFAEAQAVVSLAPTEPAGIPIVANGADATIADDFLYLLLTRPVCPQPQPTDGECECGGATEAGRLPDHDDLVGSGVYSQDLGGTCVNLSKPNRTISEFDYQAIVRTSDPDVANFVLSRVEEGIDAVDVSLAMTLASGAQALAAAVGVSLASAVSNAANSPGDGNALSIVNAVGAAAQHAGPVSQALTQPASPVTLTVLADAAHHLDAVIGLLKASEMLGGSAVDEERIIAAATTLRTLVDLGIDSVGTSARYELTPGPSKATRRPIDSDNPVNWQDAPESQPVATLVKAPLKSHFGKGIAEPSARGVTLSQAVTVATGHILHYKAVFKADGYSLGDLIYSLPLAPGQKKEIVVFDASHTLTGTETQAASQREHLATGLVDERTTTDVLAGGIAESLRGTSTANTSGISAGFGTGGQGSGSSGAYGGSGSAVLGVAGGAANANSTADQDSSRDVSQFFFERLRQSIMQNADSYRQLNASVVSTVQEGQRYGVTSEVVANHNHCHALTMMYFEVLRHFAIFQELSEVEECVFVPFLLTRFTTDNIAKWRDVLAPALLPMPSETYLQPFTAMAGPGREHPLVKAFDADQRIKTEYANVDFPAGAYDDEPIRFLKGKMVLRIDLPRPKTRYDRIKSLPVVIKRAEIDTQATVKQTWFDAMAAGLTGGLSLLFTGPPVPDVQYKTKETQGKQAIFDAFMSLDANYESVAPADCIRVTNFNPTSIMVLGVAVPVSGLDFFQDGIDDLDQWTRYAHLMGYTDVFKMLNYYFKGRLISEWDGIFYNEIVPVVFRKIVDAIRISPISADLTAETKYTGGERIIPLFLSGTTNLKRSQLPAQLSVSVASADVRALANHVTLNVENVDITYSTSHFNGLLYSGNVNNDLLDAAGVLLDIPEGPDEKRNPRREDRYLAAKLIEHLNSNLEYYNKVLWYRLDPDRRYMLLDGYSIQVFKDDGTPLLGDGGMRSLASVVKNDMISVAGNSLVFPVAPGYKVSGSFVTPAPEAGKPKVGLVDHYKPLTPPQPYRISTPCNGVFAEAVQGVCNACEKLETDRLQDWSQYPIGDEPTAIAPVGVPTPTVTDWQAAFKDFAAPIVNVQNAPGLPAPGAGLEGLAALLAQSGVFKDITGLDANQQNVLKTYLSNQDNAKAFAEMAKEMAMQSHNTQNSGKIMDSITTAKTSGAINQQEAGQLVKDHLQQQIDGGATKKIDADAAKRAAAPSLSGAAVDAASRNQDISASRVDPDGTSEAVTIKASGTGGALAEIVGTVPRLKQDKDKVNDCWAVAAAMMIGWKTNNPAVSAADAVERAGQRYLGIYQRDEGLKGADKDDFALHLEMVAEPPRSYRLQEYIDWVKTFGPIWVTTDSAVGDEMFSPHARVLVRITGTGTADGVGTEMTFVDPSTGAEASQPFLEFIRGYEEMARDSRSLNLSPQVVRFLEKVDKGEGFQIRGPWNLHEPIHETITLAALMTSDVAVPKSVKLGGDQAVNEFIRGVIWNDDPAVLMFHEDVGTNWHFSTGISWLFAFEAASIATMNNVTNLTGRSHYFDMQFLHAMATQAGDPPENTLSLIMLWAEVMYRLSTGDGIAAGDKLGNIAVTSTVTTAAGVDFTYDFASLFDDASRPRGYDTINYLLTLDTACPSLDISRRAIGSLLHTVQDSYARGHVRRTLINPADLLPGSTDRFQPGTYGRWGEVENFHCYRGQNEKLHDKYDAPLDGTPTATDLSTFNSMIGARDAIEHSVELLNMWQAKTPWAANGGPKELLEGTIFKLSGDASVANATV